jgi:hypothetical protein
MSQAKVISCLFDEQRHKKIGVILKNVLETSQKQLQDRKRERYPTY